MRPLRVTACPPFPSASTIQKSTPPSAGDHCRLTAPRELRLHGMVASRGGRVIRLTLVRRILRPVRARARGAAGHWFKKDTHATLRTVTAGDTMGQMWGPMTKDNRR